MLKVLNKKLDYRNKNLMRSDQLEFFFLEDFNDFLDIVFHNGHQMLYKVFVDMKIVSGYQFRYRVKVFVRLDVEKVLNYIFKVLALQQFGESKTNFVNQHEHYVNHFLELFFV